MKKYLLFGLLVAIFPGICSAADPRFTQLVREKQRKMAELEKCTGSTKGLQIAGISTLGLSAAGVAVNIAEAKKIKEYDKKIEDVPKQLEKKKQELEKKKQETAYAEECVKSGGKIDGNGKCKCEKSKEPDETGACQSKTGNNSENQTPGNQRPEYEISTNGESSEAKGLDEECTTEVVLKNCSGLNKGEWRVTFDSGLVTGTSKCSTTDNKVATISNLDEREGKYCWCKMVNSTITSVSSTSSWVFVEAYKDEGECVEICTSKCANSVMTSTDFRKTLFNVD